MKQLYAGLSVEYTHWGGVVLCLCSDEYNLKNVLIHKHDFFVLPIPLKISVNATERTLNVFVYTAIYYVVLMCTVYGTRSETLKTVY